MNEAPALTNALLLSQAHRYREADLSLLIGLRWLFIGIRNYDSVLSQVT